MCRDKLGQRRDDPGLGHEPQSDERLRTSTTLAKLERVTAMTSNVTRICESLWPGA